MTVSVGSQLQSKINSYGEREVDQLRADLGDSVSRALARSAAAPARVDLVIEDAQPNRPTFEQLGRSPAFAPQRRRRRRAHFRHGDHGRRRRAPLIRYQWYETDLRPGTGGGTWSDADRAFDFLASDLARGKAPDAYTGPGPDPHGGRFGYPFNGD